MAGLDLGQTVQMYLYRNKLLRTWENTIKLVKDCCKIYDIYRQLVGSFGKVAYVVIKEGNYKKERIHNHIWTKAKKLKNKRKLKQENLCYFYDLTKDQRFYLNTNRKNLVKAYYETRNLVEAYCKTYNL